MRPEKDSKLIQIVDAALADASARARKPDGTSWLACRSGCTPCCHGVFKISTLDAERLREALMQLSVENPLKAMALRARAEEAVAKLASGYPGDAKTGLLNSDETAWEKFADSPASEIMCPVLEPETGSCVLYAGRPLTCRIFGPPVRGEQGIGVCELCYVGADESTTLAGEMFLTHGMLEQELDLGLPPGETVIAWAIANSHV